MAKKTGHKIIKKRSGRYAIRDLATGKFINGDDKVKILKDKKLMAAPAPKPAAAEEAEAPAAE